MAMGIYFITGSAAILPGFLTANLIFVEEI
jgi:hypothetical protein